MQLLYLFNTHTRAIFHFHSFCIILCCVAAPLLCDVVILCRYTYSLQNLVVSKIIVLRSFAPYNRAEKSSSKQKSVFCLCCRKWEKKVCKKIKSAGSRTSNYCVELQMIKVLFNLKSSISQIKGWAFSERRKVEHCYFASVLKRTSRERNKWHLRGFRGLK